jgi:gluconate 5-dehydrogenase
LSVDFHLDGRVALVTGASRGLGWVIARTLAEYGAHVAVNSRSETDCEAKARELRDAGHKARALPFDVVDRAGATAALERLAAEHGQLDILVNNAGIIHRTELENFTDEDWRRVVSVNLDAIFSLSRDAAQIMKRKRWGRIINIASVLAIVARPSIPAYVASKHGLHGLTKALGVELAPHGITVNAIAPGYFATEFNLPLVEDAEFNAMVCRRTPAGRWGEPDELAGAALYLASSSAAYVTGAMLTVDGGMTAAL